MSKSVVDKGPWHHGVTQDGKRTFVQSEDFRHDVRLYVDGDFAGDDDKALYAKGIAEQLNAAPVSAVPNYPLPFGPISEDVRAALLFALWHHQGGSSGVGQPIRLMLGIGQHERMTPDQCDIARRVQSALSSAASAEPVGILECNLSGDGIFHPDERKVFMLPVGDYPLYTAPVAAQSDLTQQTLDDVMAGIPARDAEIEALRKEIETLQAAQTKPAFNVLAHLQRQREWSERTFGPGLRTAGVCDHIRKELREIEADPTDLREWVDVVILALDGAWRTGATPQQIIDAIVAKQVKNEGRVWPDWRTVDPNKAIEHDRSGEVQAQQPVSGAEGLPTDLELDAWAEDLSRLGYESNREGVEAYLRKLFSERAALAQQDADKVDAERWRAYRSSVAADNAGFLQRALNAFEAMGIEDGLVPSENQIDAAIDAARKEQT